MGRDYPSIYRSSYEDAQQRSELREYARSFRLNVGCACSIENDILTGTAENGLKAGCADMVLERYGFQRVNFVLAMRCGKWSIRIPSGRMSSPGVSRSMCRRTERTTGITR